MSFASGTAERAEQIDLRDRALRGVAAEHAEQLQGVEVERVDDA